MFGAAHMRRGSRIVASPFQDFCRLWRDLMVTIRGSPTFEKGGLLSDVPSGMKKEKVGQETVLSTGVCRL